MPGRDRCRARRLDDGGSLGNYADFSYWGPSTVDAGVNKKSVNWDGYNHVADQNYLVRNALDCYCTGPNWCYVAAHSAGDLMIGYALSMYGGTARSKKNAIASSTGECGNSDGTTQVGWNIKWVDIAAGAGGGSELADAGDWAVSEPLVSDLKTSTARALYDHNNTRSAWFYMYTGAKGTLSKYKIATRYPHEARPLSEHPDQLRPFDPIGEEMPLRTPGGQPAKGVRVKTTQDRVFASGAESVRFTVRAVDDDDHPLPLLVTRAVAFDMPDARRPAGRPQVPVAFTRTSEGSLAAVLQPSTQGFADFAGTLRVQAYLNQSGQLGNVNFDVVYNPLVPAEWAGVREALQNGSLDFYLKARVAQPGRYVVSARVDDAAGKPFALLSFNDEVAAGEQEFKLRLFGKLVRDGQPAFPLTLRDVQGFLLLPDRFPDHAMLARQPGTVHTSKAYALDDFSDAEWSSEERSRYLAELTKDVDEARRQVDSLTR